MRVAVDVTPLRGAVTGVGQTVAGLLQALPGAAPDVDVARWELTRRSFPLPPAVLVRVWARTDHPRGDRWLPDADVLHGTNFVVPPSRRPATVTIHDCWCARMPGACESVIAARTSTVQRAVDRGAWVHVSTEWGAREVREVYGATERVAVVPFGVPPVPEAGPPPVDGPYVLALGATDHRKGHAELVRSFGAVAADLPDVRLVLAGGDGNAATVVTRAIDESGVAGRVLRPGWVDATTRAALLRGARALAYPSVYEGFGFPVLEAMSVGVPVVATAAGAVPEVAGDAALLVTPGNTDELAAALVTAVNDDAERAWLVDAGHRRAAGFSWESHARGMADLWRAALAAGR